MFGEPQPEAVIEVLRAQAERAAEIRRQLAELVGEARSEDTLVSAVVGAQGLQELVLEPKAMRMPSAELAETIVGLTQRARENLEARRAERAAELGAGARPGIQESLGQLDRLRSLVDAGHGDLRTVFEKFRDQSDQTTR